MDEQDKHLVSFDRDIEEPAPVKTVEIEYPRTTYNDEPAHAAGDGRAAGAGAGRFRRGADGARRHGLVAGHHVHRRVARGLP